MVKVGGTVSKKRKMQYLQTGALGLGTVVTIPPGITPVPPAIPAAVFATRFP